MAGAAERALVVVTDAERAVADLLPIEADPAVARRVLERVPLWFQTFALNREHGVSTPGVARDHHYRVPFLPPSFAGARVLDAAPVCEPEQWSALPPTQGARHPGRRDCLLACDADLADYFALASRDAKAMLVRLGAPGNGIAAQRRRRQVADGARIPARDERAAHLAAEREPPR